MKMLYVFVQNYKFKSKLKFVSQFEINFIKLLIIFAEYKTIETMLKSLFHWKVLVNLIIAAAFFIGIVWLTFRWLEYHTHHGEEIPVPNVMNRSVHDAIKTLDDSGLDYEVDSFKYDPKYRPFQVLDIDPKPGANVKGGRTIFLKVNPRTWAPVGVPNILDKYKGLAFRRLDAVGLKVGDTIFEPNIQRDAVIRMLYKGNSIKPGALVPKFSTIDLVIGTGPKRNIGVPNLVGLTVAEAKAIIANNLFEVGLIEHEDGKADDSDIVYFQDPAGGDIRDQGMQIDIWASKKTPAEMSAKIAQLNSIYRMKIDTTLPPVRYEEAPTYIEPSYDTEPPKKVEPAVVQPKETPKSATPTNNTPQPKPTTTNTKPTSAATKPSEKPSVKEEKPKVKKVVD